MSSEAGPEYGRSSAWQPERPRWRVFPLLVSWFATGVALMVAAGILPGVDIENFWGALVVAAIIGALNAVIPPALAALRLPLTLVLGFLLVLIADALMLQLAAEVTDGVLTVDNFGWALLAALIVGAVSVVFAVLLGSDDMGSIRIAQTDRASGRASSPAPTSPGSSISRSTGSRCRCCAGRCATAMPRTWLAGRATRTVSPSGRPISRRRRVPARRGSSWVRTRTSPRSAGWRRRPQR